MKRERPGNKFQERDRSYVRGLEYFLKDSDEDQIVANAIVAQFPKYAPEPLDRMKRKKTAKVLDIGSGNGAKALHFAQQLAAHGIDIVVDSVEPKEPQRRGLAKTYLDHPKHAGKIYPCQLGELETEEHYDIALLMHSLYEFPRNADGTIATLERLRIFLDQEGVGIIILEHPAGDFQKMKSELYPLFGKSGFMSQKVIEATLAKCRIPYRLGDVIEMTQRLDLGKSDRGLGKSFSFMFSNSLRDSPLDFAQIKKLGEWVRGNVRSEGNCEDYLWAPNIAIWVYNK